MARVTGIGGVFLRAKDPDALSRWYRENLGLPVENGFAVLRASDDAPDAQTTWSAFDPDTEYFGSQTQQVMIDYRVDDLDALLEQLGAAGVTIAPERQEEPYGKFAWITDPEGNRIELWQPLAEADASGVRDADAVAEA